MLILTIFSFYSSIVLAQECAIPDLQSLDFESIKRLIQNPDCGIRSVGETLAHLPRSLSNHQMLFFRSRSLQGPHTIDYLNPRALIFRPDYVFKGRDQFPTNSFVISFNGHPSQPGYRALEMVEIHRETPANVFRYYEILFPADDAQAEKTDWQSIQNQMHYSNANPSRCTACHGTPARPIMPGYPQWEGAFGSFHDAKLPAEEMEGLANYARKVRGSEKSRYKLIQDPIGSSSDASIDGLLFTRDSDNGILNGILGTANGIRVADLIRHTPNYDRFRYTLAAAFSDCGPIETFVPRPVIKALLQNMESQFHLRARWQDPNKLAMAQRIYNTKDLFVLSSLVEADREKPSYNGSANQRVPFNVFAKRLKAKIGFDADYERLQLDTFYIQGVSRADYMGGQLRLLMEGRGLKIDNWFMDLSQPTYRYLDGGGAEYSTAKSLADQDPTFDPSLKDAFLHKYVIEHSSQTRHQEKLDDAVSNFKCERLKQLSLASLNGYSVLPVPPAPVASSLEDARYPSVFRKTCAACHDPVEGEPLCTSIPFRSPQLMARWMTNPDHVAMLQGRVLSLNEDTRMPPTRLLTDDELNAVVKYIGSH